MIRSRSALTVIAAVFTLAGPPTLSTAAPPRDLILPAGVTELSVLEQNWTEDEARWFYNVPQGSKLLPYKWFLHLEQAERQMPFLDPDHIHQLGYLPRTANPAGNPDGLPVGFTKDGDHVGLTCAACHTSLIRFEGKAWLIDGGPTHGDFELFLRRLVAALDAAHSDEAKWNRFAANVLGAGSKDAAKAQLKEQLKKELAERKAYNDRNLPAAMATRYGPGRVDAFGAILNQVAVGIAGVPDNAKPADAPVSYPFLWDAPQHDFVQWNGVAPNKKTTNSLLQKIVGTAHIGALGRNAGEVLGVFGTMDATDQGSIFELRGYKSSIHRKNLIDIETSLFKLWSPQWPSAFPSIDEGQKAKGAELYKTNCADCHASIDRKSATRTVTAMVVAVGTDPTMAMNFKTREGKTGHLNGRVVSLEKLPFSRFGEDARVALMLRHVVQRGILQPDPELFAAIKNEKLKLIQAIKELDDQVDFQLVGQVATELGPQLERLSFPARLDAPIAPAANRDVAYKARPLNGIWATAPYLHNGSVANLDELLKSPGERKAFKVGSREFDTVHVGFKTTEGVDFDPTLKGNRNTGHDYGRHKRPTDMDATTHTGPRFTADERAALIAYLKSL